MAERLGNELRPALPSSFYARPAQEVARDLLGCILTSECGVFKTVGRIVETEAYTGPEDPACHAAAAIGRTSRNDPLFGPPGTVYIHLNYGVHWCLNAVTEREGFPAAVLIRALSPLAGKQEMLRRRGRSELTNGPARLTQAMAIGPELQRHPLDCFPLWLSLGTELPDRHVVVTTRVGISKGTERKLRYYDGRSRWISRR